MSVGARTPETPGAYDYASHLTLECPKCGHKGVFPFSKTDKATVEYAGVCVAVLDAGRWCGTVFTVHVTSHVFPAR